MRVFEYLFFRILIASCLAFDDVFIILTSFSKLRWMDAYIHAYMHTRLHAWIYAWMHVWMHGCLDAWSIHACIHACIHAYLRLSEITLSRFRNDFVMYQT